MTKTEGRKALAIIAASFGAIVGYVALTAPMIVMTGPTILSLALLTAAWFLWPHEKHEA